MMRLSKEDSFLLVERQPLCRVGRDFWVVMRHGDSLWRLTDKLCGRTPKPDGWHQRLVRRQIELLIQIEITLD